MWGMTCCKTRKTQIVRPRNHCELCRQYSARTAAACALLDEFHSWHEALCKNLGLGNTRKQEALAAAELLVANYMQQTQAQAALPPAGI